jgi:hypothetical protein
MSVSREHASAKPEVAFEVVVAVVPAVGLVPVWGDEVTVVTGRKLDAAVGSADDSDSGGRGAG